VIFPLVFVLTVVAGLSSTFPGWSSPTVRSAALIAHIVFILLGYAALLFTAVAAVAYLFQEQELKRKSPRGLALKLPPLATLDEIISSSLSLGFVAITIGTVIGAVWAFVEFGTRWIADPRIGISFVTWGIYLALVFFRASAGWRGRKAALLAIAALCGSVVTWVAHVGILSE
jgi:ABC-type transport system involved in cytochrome c biogenesis permease subunit